MTRNQPVALTGSGDFGRQRREIIAASGSSSVVRRASPGRDPGLEARRDRAPCKARIVQGHVTLLADDAALWSVGEAPTAKLVDHACAALVDGLDSQALRELAGVSPTAPENDLEDLLRRLADDFDFEFHWRHSENGRAAAARVLARRCVDGSLPPREFARWMHGRIGHGHQDRQVEALVSLDDEYDVAVRPTDDIDRAVLNAARDLLRSQEPR
jgi:hypothetical protein